MPLQETSGNLTTDAYGGGAAAAGPAYIEDVFSTYLYTGNGSTQTITNDIDLSGKGGLLWIKNRTSATYPGNYVFDSARGAGSGLVTNTTAAADGSFSTGFTTSGFTLAGDNATDQNTITYVSWTFRKQPKFFDVVTWTGNAVLGRTISHNLGSVPGVMIVKCTSTATDWVVYSNAIANDTYLKLNSTAAKTVIAGYYPWNSTSPTSTVFTIDGIGGAPDVNASGETYVAYLFAHNAGGFGLTGTDNVISCGSYTTNGAGVGSATLGWEPQWLLLKVSSGTGGWVLIDNMRGFVAPGGGSSANLIANTAAAESTIGIKVNATGFTDPGVLVASGTVIYIAIRRGPMKVPTDATKVFSPNVASNSAVTTNFPIDTQIFYIKGTNDTIVNGTVVDRLRGVASTTTQQGNYLQTSSTAAQDNTYPYMSKSWNNVGFSVPDNTGGSNTIYWNFRRAPSFFDEVCYTGTGAATTFSHNLAVVPELMIVKQRDTANSWMVYNATVGASSILNLNTSSGSSGSSNFNNTNPTASVFSVGSFTGTNESGGTYVNYLFATCAGVSKVGSYTGNGTTQTINCGFTAGARFVLIKRTDSTGYWYVYDTARGMTTLTDPYLLLNSTAAETATLGSVTTVSTGFAVNAAILAAINTNAASYIFLAIS
jgi:hypothetical protein